MIKRIDQGVAGNLGEKYRASSDGLVTHFRVSKDPGLLTGLIVSNKTDVDGFIHLLDAKEMPEDGATPILAVPLPASAAIGIDTPIFVTQGLVVAISTTLEELEESTNEAFVYANFTVRR